MKYAFFLVAFLAGGFVFAQEATTVTDDELQKYAVAQDSIETLKKQFLASITEKVNSSDKISVARYNELYKISKDDAKLAEAKATPEEIAFLKEVAALKEEGTAKVNAAIQSLAKDYVGVATYNKIKKALTSDTALKSRYDQIMTSIKAG